jgi:hypothetical protein
MENLVVLIPFVVVFGIFALVTRVAIKQQQRVRDNLTALAQRYGLQVPETPKGFLARMKPFAVSGTHRGRALRIYSYTTGSGKNATHWCALGLGVRNPGGFTLQIARENVFTKVGRAFGIEDANTGDKSFDDQFHLKSNDPAFVRAALIPEVRAQIAGAWKDGARGSFTVDKSEIKYAETGSFATAKICERFPALVELSYTLADVVEARPA